MDRFKEIKILVSEILYHYKFVSRLEYKLPNGIKVDVVGVKDNDIFDNDSLALKGIGVEITYSSNIGKAAAKLYYPFRWKIIVTDKNTPKIIKTKRDSIYVVSINDFERILRRLLNIPLDYPWYNDRKAKDDDIDATLKYIKSNLEESKIPVNEFFDVIDKLYLSGSLYSYNHHEIMLDNSKMVNAKVIAALEAFNMINMKKRAKRYVIQLSLFGLAIARKRIESRIRIVCKELDALIDKYPIHILKIICSRYRNKDGYIDVPYDNDYPIHDLLIFIVKSREGMKDIDDPRALAIYSNLERYYKVYNKILQFMKALERLGLATKTLYINNRGKEFGKYYAPPEVSDYLLKHTEMVGIDEAIIKHYGMINAIYSTLYENVDKARRKFNEITKFYGIEEDDIKRYLDKLNKLGLTGKYIKGDRFAPFIILDRDKLYNYLQGELDYIVDKLLS